MEVEKKHQIGEVHLEVDEQQVDAIQKQKESTAEQFRERTGFQPVVRRFGREEHLGFRDLRLHDQAARNGKPPLNGEREKARRLRQLARKTESGA